MPTSTNHHLVALLVMVALACSPQVEDPAWQLTDLCLKRPRIETNDGRIVAKRVRVETIPLGPSDLRSLADGPTAASDPQDARLRPGLAKALRQPDGNRLVFSTSPGDPAFLEFRPLATPAGQASCRHRVAARWKGEEESLWEHGGLYSLWPPPELVSLDLSRFAGRDIELVFELVGEGECERSFYWVSPAIVSARDSLPVAPTSGKLNVLLVGADTLRADALGAYGARPSVTPALDRLADSSDVWLEAYSTFNVTVPSFSSILTGLYGKNHGVYENSARLPDSAVTMAELLSAAGYGTAAFLAAGHLYSANLGQEFDHVQKPPGHLAGETIVNGAIDWLQGNSKPFFVWVHLFDAHTPHTPPGRFNQGFRPAEPSGLGPVPGWVSFDRREERLIQDDGTFAREDLYRGSVAYIDRQVDRLLGFLKSNDLLDKTIVIFLADHGELIDEHSISFHHTGFWDEVVRVPLIIHWPGSTAGRRLQGLVQTIDVLPTVLSELGLPLPPMDGRPVLNSSGHRREMVFAEHDHRVGSMIRTPGNKYFHSRFDYAFPSGDYLYDMRHDPDETINTARARPEITLRLREALATWLRTSGGTAMSEEQRLSSEELEELRALGYVN